MLLRQCRHLCFGTGLLPEASAYISQSSSKNSCQNWVKVHRLARWSSSAQSDWALGYRSKSPTSSSNTFGGGNSNGDQWKNGLDLKINMQQSIKKGVPIPMITEDLIGWHSVPGRRVTNEDRVAVRTMLNGTTLFVGLFDGHGSSSAVDFVSHHLASHLESWLRHTHNIQACLKQAFIDINNLWSKHVWSLMLQCEDEVARQDLFKQAENSGTTAVVCVLRQSEELVVGSVGDSSAILCRMNHAHPLHTHHTPDQPAEQKRVTDRGGFISSNSFGQILVNGRLAMTRSVGDCTLRHTGGVISVPATKSIQVKHHRDQFLVLLSDGISQVMNDQEIADLISSHAKDPAHAARLLTDMAMQYGSDDNSTALVLPLGAWGRGPPRHSFRDSSEIPKIEASASADPIRTILQRRD